MRELNRPFIILLLWLSAASGGFAAEPPAKPANAEERARMAERRTVLAERAKQALFGGKYADAAGLLQQCVDLQGALGERIHPTTAVLHLQLGVTHARLGKTAASQASHEASLAVANQCLVDKKPVPSTVFTANWMALSRLHSGRGEYPKAAAYLEHYRNFRLKQKTLTPATRIAVGGKLADYYYEQREYKKALTLLETDREAVAERFAEGTATRCRWELRVAEHHLKLGDFDSADKALGNALDYLKQQKQTGSLHLRAISLQAELLEARGEEKNVPALLDFARKLASRLHGENSNEYAEQLVRRGRFDLHHGRLLEALVHLQKALAITQKIVGPKHPRHAQMLVDNAMAEMELGQDESALKKFNHAIDLYEGAYGRDSPFICAPLQMMGLAYTARGNYSAAQICLVRALRISEQKLGKEHQETALLLGSLGHLKATMLDLESAQALLDRSLKLHLKWYGPNHSRTLKMRGERAVLFETASKIELARAEYEAVRKGHEANGESGTPSANLNLMRLARVMGGADDAAAAKLFANALAAAQKTYGENHSELALVRHHAARHHARQGRMEKALAEQTAAVALLRQLKQEDTPMYANALGNLAEYELAAGQADAALASLREMLARQHALYQQTLGKLTEANALTFLQGQQFANARLQAMVAQLPTRLPALQLGAEHLAQTKARLEEIRWAQSRVQHTRAEQVPQARARVAALQAQLAHLKHQPGLTVEQRVKAGVNIEANLRRAEGALGKLVLQTDTAVARQLAAQQLKLDDLSRLLPRDSMLLDFASYLAAEEDGTRRKHYVAYFTRPSPRGSPKVSRVDLGQAAEIDAAIIELRRLMYQGLVAPERLAPALARLDRLLGQPLHQAIGKLKMTRLFVCPDSLLAQLPFEMLPHEKGHWVDAFQISYLGSARELRRLAAEAPAVKPGPALVLNQPEYGRQQAGRPLQFAPLASGEQDPATLMNALGQGTKRLAGARATEENLKAVRAPRVLHLSTHAYYLGDPLEQGQPRQLLQSVPADLQPVRGNPLLNCGLALAEANTAEQLPFGVANEGLFTGLEAAQLNLHGTELVILSACESGVGDDHPGEGAMSLRRAFRVAGAESVLASHWPVSDEATNELMTHFLKHWRAGKPRVEALRAAQQSLRKSEDWSSPYFWAAFTLMGEWR